MVRDRLRRMDPYEKLNVAAFALVVAVAPAFAAAIPEVRTPALALGAAAAAQLPVWLSAPLRSRLRLPASVVVLECALAIGFVVASVLASAWFALPAAFTGMSAIGLVWARRVSPTTPATEPAEVPTAPEPAGAGSVAELRALRPRLARVNDILVIFLGTVAAFFVVMAIVDVHLLVAAAVFASFAGAVRLAEWLTAKTTPPSVRRELERRRPAR